MGYGFNGAYGGVDGSFQRRLSEDSAGYPVLSGALVAGEADSDLDFDRPRCFEFKRSEISVFSRIHAYMQKVWQSIIFEAKFLSFDKLTISVFVFVDQHYPWILAQGY